MRHRIIHTILIPIIPQVCSDVPNAKEKLKIINPLAKNTHIGSI